MSGYKNHRYADRTSVNYESRLARATGKVSRPVGADKAGEVASWDAYKNWLTKVQAPEKHRNVPDVALSSWKGYRSWAEKVRRNWDTLD